MWALALPLLWPVSLPLIPATLLQLISAHERWCFVGGSPPQSEISEADRREISLLADSSSPVHWGLKLHSPERRGGWPVKAPARVSNKVGVKGQRQGPGAGRPQSQEPAADSKEGEREHKGGHSVRTSNLQRPPVQLQTLNPCVKNCEGWRHIGLEANNSSRQHTTALINRNESSVVCLSGFSNGRRGHYWELDCTFYSNVCVYILTLQCSIIRCALS